MEVKTEAAAPELPEISYKKLTWINLEKPTRREVEELGERYPLHRLELDDCLSKIQLTKVDQYEHYLFTILHFPIPHGEGKRILSSQISIFLGRDFLITVHQGDLKPVSRIFQTCRDDEQQRKVSMGKGSGFLLYRILDSLVDDLFPLIDHVFSDLDAIEDRVFDEVGSAVQEITILRREISDLRRILYPHRRVIPEIAVNTRALTKEELSVYFSDVINHIDKVWESLEETRETIDIFKDTDFMLNTEKANRILALLTILFTLSIPATLLGTLYGMNIYLPGGIATGPFLFLGEYTTLYLIILASVIPASIMLWYFRRQGWI